MTPEGSTAIASDFVRYHEGLLPTDKPDVRFRILGHVPSSRIFVELWRGDARRVKSFASASPSRTREQHEEGIHPVDARRAFIVARTLRRSVPA